MRSVLMGLIGEGVTPSLTPPMHEREAREHGVSLVYRPLDLLVSGRDPRSIGELLRAGVELGFDGFNVTHPCKQLVLEALDAVDEDAARLGAVNTVLVKDGRLLGRNTDRSGFASGLAHALPGARLDHVVQLGAGGAGAAVADALVGAGTRRLTLVDPDAGRGEALARLLRSGNVEVRVDVVSPEAAPSAVADASGLVNASPIGMFTHPGLPLPVEALHDGLWVADVVYRPARTALLEAALERGLPTMAGGHMAVGQAADTFALVTGLTPDRERMRAHFDSMVAVEVPAA